MKKFYILFAFFILASSQLNAQYFWQVERIVSINGGNTYDQNEIPNDIKLNLTQCAGGIRKPHNLTSYTLKWYVNTTDSNNGGIIYSSSNQNTQVNFHPVLSFRPPTNVVGTYYYYAEFSNPSMTTCGFTGTLTSQTVEVIVKPQAARAKNITVQLDGNGNATITPAQIDNGSSSTVGIASLALNITSFNCSDLDGGPSTEVALKHIGSRAINHRAHGGGYNPHLDEFWFPQWGDSTVYKTDPISGASLGSFNLPKDANMQLWMDKSSTDTYTANFGYQTITRSNGNTVVWSTNIGGTAGNVTTDANYVYTSAYFTDQLKVLDKATGVLVATYTLPDYLIMYGGLVHANGKLYAFGIALFGTVQNTWNAVHIFDASDGTYLSSQSLNYPTYYGVSFDGENVWLGTGRSLEGYQIASGNAYGSSSSDSPGSGSKTVTLTVTENDGKVSSATAIVTVEDNIAPNTPILADVTGKCDATATVPTTTDNCSGTINGTTSDSLTYSALGTHVITWSFDDGNGNVTKANQNVIISGHFKETLDLRSLTSFEAFTGTGAVTNSGTFTGDVGTNVGALTGFTGPSFIGNTHINNALTVQADIDLLEVYIHLNNIFETHPGTHAPAFGNGETLTPGVYSIGGAGSVAGTLTLDGQGDPNAVFIMKFKGAFTAGAATNIVLINGADAANVFWVAQGALSVGASSVIKGTLLAYPGAITLGVNSSIEGRLLSSVGAITVGVGGTATMPGDMYIPINPMVSYTPAAAVDVLGSIENFSLFTINGAVANASTSGILGDVGADIGAISGFATSAHIGSFYNADAVTAQAKIDLNNAYSQLMLIPTTVSNHTPAFGSGETLQAGVYATPGAGSLAGTITLDGQGNDDAVFIFKFNGAFAAAAQSKVIFSNGTRRCNVFWISEGATSIGSFSMIKGTVLAHNGAATMGAGGNLEGRLLSTGGAIGFSTGVVYTVVSDVECDNYTEQKTTTKRVVATAPESIEETLVIYPNPSKGVFNIKLAIFNVQTDVYLFDTTGKLIARKSISKENNSGNTIAIGNNNLSSGIYLVKIITKDQTTTKKLIVEKSN